MRKILLSFLTLLFALFVTAQAPQGVNYQAVVRNAAGQTLPAGTNVTLRFQIHDVNASGAIVFQETATATTNEFGLVTHVIGSTGNLGSVNWAVGEKYLQVEIDVNGGANFTDMGTSQLMSVPYALFAGNAVNGATGPTGPDGATGANGLQGPAGNNGANGNTGSTGATGANGTNGVAGPTGATGISGTNGATGANGANGATGTTGNTGINGANGLEGATGPTGSTGANGTNGATGVAGPTGANGINGATGATGNAGANGVNGIDGVTGATGAAGTNGLDGPTGSTGLAGANGANGATGPAGATGATGMNGATGTNGTNGTTGATGTDGTNGVTGATGAQGDPGQTGATGATGANGPQGATGATGATGAQGIPGATASTGATGPTGPSGPSVITNVLSVSGDTLTSTINGVLSNPVVVATLMNDTSIYKQDGQLTGNRIVTMAGKTLNFTGGNIGIGGSSPTHKLDVTGTLKTDSFFMPTGAAKNAVLTSDSLGNGKWTQSDLTTRLAALAAANQASIGACLTQLSVVSTGYYANGNPNAIAVSGAYAYVIDQSKVKVFNVSDRTNPVLVDSVAGGSDPYSIAISGNYAYVVDAAGVNNALRIYDISNPPAIHQVDSVLTGGSAACVTVSGNYAYVAVAGNNTLNIYDISSPANTTFAGIASTGNIPFSVAVSGNYAYVIDFADNDLRVYDVSNHAGPFLAGAVATGIAPHSVAVSGNYVYVVDGQGGDMRVYDVSNPAAPIQRSITSEGGAQAIVVLPPYAYVTGEYNTSYLHIYNINNPDTPVLAASLTAGAGPVAEAIADGYAYVVDYNSYDLRIYSLACGVTLALNPQTATVVTSNTISQGSPGNVGPAGPVGPMGPQGIPGVQGIQGLAGVTGPTGSNGITGVKGDTGPTGATGANGNDGANGNTGPTGPTGVEGQIGATGAPGDTGAPGSGGGATGPTGATGATGFLSNGGAAGNTTYWNGTEWVTNSNNIFNNGGNVGIGTGAPDAALDVNGAIRASNNQTSHAQGAWLEWNKDGGGGKTYLLNQQGGGVGGVVLGSVDIANVVRESVTVAANGNVGIGTTSPASLLHLQAVNVSDTPVADMVLARYWGSNTDTRASSVFHFNNSATNSDNLAFGVAGNGGSYDQPNSLDQIKMLIQANGNVGIGTATPTSVLDVVNSTAGEMRLQLRNTGTGNAGFEIRGTDANSQQYIDFTNGAIGATSPDYSSRIISNKNSISLQKGSGYIGVINAGRVGIGTANPDTSAALDISSTTAGLLYPRLTQAQRNAIAVPASGLTIYNTTTNCLELYAAGAWISISCACTAAPATPFGISGAFGVCPGLPFTYGVTATQGASSYNWTVTGDAGAVITPSANGASAVITFSNAASSPVIHVSAQNNCGISALFNQAVTASTAPAATPVLSFPTVGTSTSFTVTWNAVANATGYYLDVATDPNFISYQYNALNTGNVTSYNITGLSSCVTYYVRVRAYNACQAAGNNSNTISHLTSATFTATYYHTGATQTFVVPACVTRINVKAWAAGGAGWTSGSLGAAGGSGAYVSGYITVTPGTTYYVIVGGGGTLNATGAFGGGAAGGVGSASGGGGGYSGMFNNTVPTQAGAIFIAGGGGGAGSSYNANIAGIVRYHGGGGGGNAGIGNATGEAGQAGSSGGAAGTAGSNSGGTGIALQGGTGNAVSHGGGGGGGYVGGGGGAGNSSDQGGGGGGGASFTSGSGFTLISAINGSNHTGAFTAQGDGPMDPPATNDPAYSTGIGVGSEGALGGFGKIFIYW